MSRLFEIMWIIGGSVVLTTIILVISVLPYGNRDVTPLETIQGIPYPHSGDTIHVLEPLAHLDVKLIEPVIAKKLTLHFWYQPHATEQLAVGVRENSFWLSYPLNIFYSNHLVGSADWQEASVTIPLTDKLADTDRSIDVMFFANPGTNVVQLAQQTNPLTNWDIKLITAQVQYAWPTMPQLKDYIKSVVYRERPV